MNNLHKKYYFSGAQAHIYIGNYEITEVIQLEGSLMVPQIPIYGFASSLFDTVGTGKILGTGALTINYISPGYLLSFLNKNKEEMDAIKSSDSTNKSPGSLNAASINEGQEIDSFLGLNGFSDIAYLSDEEVLKKQERYWQNRENISSTSFINPEFASGPFDIFIRDFKIGISSDLSDLDNVKTYEEKVMKDVFLQRSVTGRSPDSGVTVESYSFICKTII